MGLGGQLYAPASLPQGKGAGTCCIGGWVGPRARLDGCGKSHPHRDSIPGPTSPWPVAVPFPLSQLISRLSTYVHWLYLKVDGLNIPSLWAHKTFYSVYLQVVNNAASRARLAENIVIFAKEYGFDGIDLDWEYPTDKVSDNISLLSQWI